MATTGSTPEVVLAVDVGGTGIKAALCDRHCTVLAAAGRDTPVADGVPAVVAAICAVIEELAGQAGPATIVGVGLILPGVVDAAAGIARYSANIGWRDLAIRDQVRDRAGLPVAIEHDVRAAGLAEATLGAARGISDALYVGIGTGIAAASIVGGRLVPGASNLAGEIGHLPAVPDGEPCSCGQRGCLERYASGSAIARRYRERTGRSATAAEVIGLLDRDDPVAGAVFGEALDALARTLTGCVLLLDPQLIVLGGGLSRAGDVLLGPLAERIDAGLGWRPPVPLRAAHFGDRSGRVGAALIGWQAAG